MKATILAVSTLLTLASTAFADLPAPIAGEAQQALVSTARQTSVVLLEEAASPTRVEFELALSPASTPGVQHVYLSIGASDPNNWRNPALGLISLGRRGGEHDGLTLTAAMSRFDAQQDKLVSVRNEPLVFWPTRPAEQKAMTDDGVARQSWHGRWLAVRVDVEADCATAWIEGRMLHRWERAGTTATPIVLTLSVNDALRNLRVTPLPEHPRFTTVDLSALAQANARRAATAPETDVPLELVDGGRRVLSLRQAGWIDQKRDPQSYYEQYDGGPYTLNDVRQPMFRLPKADYSAAHVLVHADADENLTNVLSVRMGRYGLSQQVIQRDHVVEVPRSQEGEFQLVRVPLTDTVAQDVLDDFLDVELTKELYVTRHVPDPNRFRIRPLGLPSGLSIAAITFEKSPLQMRVYSDESGHAFVEPASAVFKVDLTNITGAAQAYKLSATATHLYGGQTQAQVAGSVEPGETATVELPIDAVRRGYHDIVITLEDGDGRLLLRRKTSFALLPPDTRRHRDQAPWGMWEWKGGHVSATDSDLVGSLYKKIGFRYGMPRHSPEMRAKWGVVYGFESQLDPELKTYKRDLEANPDLKDTALMFHETSISGPHVTRVPDIFHDRPAYRLNEKEQARFDQMWETALAATRAAREQFPNLKISLGNGPLPTKEELYRRGFPKELFDFAGNEPGSFHRFPETQPPDYVGYNASIWMDRQLLDAYGYSDKQVHQCYEIGYPGDNPGNHDSRTQADYFVRLCLHSLAWEMDFVHLGMIMDTGNSYYFSNWGATGFCRTYPEMNVKPAFVALATMTSVLDGARLVKAHDTGSPSVYAMEFERPDRTRVLAYWTLRGRRPLTITATGSAWKRIDDQANEHPCGEVEIASPTVHYLVGNGQVQSIRLGEPEYGAAPPDDATVVAALDSLDRWRKLDERSFELETYNFMTPRRKGDFTFTTVNEGGKPALRVEPRPIAHGKDTMSMYERLEAAEPIALPGEPNEIGVWVNGNSGWGRVIFELRDASGQRWVSLGAAAAEKPHPWMLDWMSKEQLESEGKIQHEDWNANDAYGVSRINFDGWRYVGFPLPGNFPGEKHPWPANCNWRWDGDGVVHYPLTLVGIAVELPEKVLHLTEWKPAPRQSIDLREITVGWQPRWLNWEQ